MLGIPRRRIRSFSPLRRKVGDGATVQSWLVETTANLFCLLFLCLGLLDSSDGSDGESAGICGALAGRILLPLVFSGAAALVGGPPVEDSAWRYVLCFFQEMELWCFPMGSFLFRVDGFVVGCRFIYQAGYFGLPSSSAAVSVRGALGFVLLLIFFDLSELWTGLQGKGRCWGEGWRSLTTDGLVSRISCSLHAGSFLIWARREDGGSVNWTVATLIVEHQR